MSGEIDSTTFKLIFDGRLIAGRNAAQVEEQFADRFGESVARAVFDSPPVTIKKGLSRADAMKMQKLMERLGLEVLMVPVEPTASNLALADDPVPTRSPVRARPSKPSPQPRADPAADTTLTRPKPGALPGPRPDKPSGGPAREASPEFGVLPQRQSPASVDGAATRVYSISELDDAFAGDVEVPGGSRKYLLGLLPVTLVMLLLPAIYLAITACSAWVVFWLLSDGLDIALSMRRFGLLRVIGFAAALIAAVLLTLFLLRPLIARPHKGAQPVRLDPDREPGLYHLVHRITDIIGAPMPHEILVDTDVNASARLTHGAFSNTLTLTIGLPLFYGTNVQTLAGILAHEFGHFTQRWGMRSSYLVHQINFWFFRQIHLRDSWDEFVDDLLERDFLVLNIAAMLAQIGSLLCRTLLSALSWLASVFSYSFSRQMEFDADRFEIALLGSKQYCNTAETLRVLGTGHRVAVDDLTIALDGDKLVDNLPRLAAHKSQNFAAADRQRIAAAIDDINTSVFDSHPTDKARIQKAIDYDLPPRFVHTGTAEHLLRDIERLSKLATLQWYRSVGVAAGPDDLVPLAEFESETENLERASQSNAEYFGAYDPLPGKLPLLEEAALKNISEQALHAELVDLRSTLQERKRKYVLMKQELDLQVEYQYYYGQAIFWRRVGFDIDLNAYRLRLTTSDVAEIEGKLADYRSREAQLRSELAPAVALQGRRMCIGLELAKRTSPDLRQEINALLVAYEGLAGIAEDDRDLRESGAQLDLLLQLTIDFEGHEKQEQDLKAEALKNERLQQRIRSLLANIPNPRDASLALGDALPADTGDQREPAVTLAESARFYRQLMRLTFKIEGRMSEIALQSERAVAAQRHRQAPG